MRGMLRLLPDPAFLRSSAIVMAGFAAARLLGFLFSVAAARTLAPAAFGQMAYVLAVASVAALLLNAAPTGLARSLVRGTGDRNEQEACWVNWLAVVGLLLSLSLAVSLPAAAALGVHGWLLAGLAANLLGVAVLETYRELQRGVGGYAVQALHYVLANLLQLLAIVAAARAGAASPALFVLIYGLSAPAALLVITAWRPLPLAPGALSRERMRAVARFIRPLLLESAFYAVWIGGDVVLVERMRGAAEAGVYAAAKAVANGFVLVPLVVQFVFVPRVARLEEERLLGSLLRVLALTALLCAPAAAVVMALARPLLAHLFGPAYTSGVPSLTVLVAGMAAYGFRGALAGLWVGLGRPVVASVSAGAGALALVGLGLWAVPRWGAPGAAGAFAAGAVMQVAVAGAATAWALGGRRPRAHHAADPGIAT